MDLHLPDSYQVFSNLLYQAYYDVGFPGGSIAKSPPAMQEMRVQSLGQEDGNLLQYSCLEIPWTEEFCGLQSAWSQRVRHDLATTTTNHDEAKVDILCQQQRHFQISWWD